MSERERVLELLADFATAIEAAAVDLKHGICKPVDVATLSEDPFLGLAWEKREGARIGEFEVTTKAANSNSDAVNHCLNVLKANNAAINNRFHCEGWQYGYWLYASKPDTIYRQSLKKT